MPPEKNKKQNKKPQSFASKVMENFTRLNSEPVVTNHNSTRSSYIIAEDIFKRKGWIYQTRKTGISRFFYLIIVLSS